MGSLHRGKDESKEAKNHFFGIHWEEGFPHHDKKAVVFLDGHSETLTKEEWEKARSIKPEKAKHQENVLSPSKNKKETEVE